MSEKDLRLMRIMLVDDNKYFLSICNEALRAYGVRKIDKMSDPVAALDMLRREWLDVVILDMNMPVLDGITFTKLLRADKASPNNNVAVIMLTAHHEQAIVEEALRAGVSGFVVKPLKPVDLIKRLQAAIEEPRPHFRLPQKVAKTSGGASVIPNEPAERYFAEDRDDTDHPQAQNSAGRIFL